VEDGDSVGRPSERSAEGGLDGHGDWHR
jgi:hypothetical protein